MSSNIDFRRFDRDAELTGFSYKSRTNAKDLSEDFFTTSMDKTGYNIHISVQNWLVEPVLLGGNLRVGPTRIKSLRRDGGRVTQDHANCVIITIYSTENNTHPDPKKRLTQTNETKITIPGRMLSQGSLFISELDCYLMTESQLDATRELIARDVTPAKNWDRINLPSSMVQQDPTALYGPEYKQLAKFCIERQDKISIRVGVDLKYGVIPPAIKAMHVSILDSYFIPFTVYKLVYDPTLQPDEFVIENLHLASRDEFRSTFSRLAQEGSMFLDHDEQETMFGTFYGMGIFADEDRYSDYVFRRKTQERFRDETLYVAERSGDPRLKEEVASQRREILTLRDTSTLQETTIKEKDETIKGLRVDVRERERTIEHLRTGHAARMAAETVVAEVENESKKVVNETLKLKNDATDQAFREKTAPLAHKVAHLKNVGEILKSGWGIASMTLTGVLSVLAVCKKYNIRIVMSK